MESTKHEQKFSGDVVDKAKKLGWIKEFSKGQFIYNKQYTELARKIEAIIVNEIGLTQGFSEYLFPKLIPLQLMKKMGYLEHLANTVYYASELGKEPDFVLAPAQCEPFFWLFENTIVDNKLPIKIMDRSGYTYRVGSQSNRTGSVERLKEFLKIELMWLGKPKDVEKTRQDLLKKTLYVFDEIFEMNWSVETNGSPFYLIGKKKEDSYPKVSKYRIKSGALDQKEASIDLVSLNCQGPYFTNIFNINEKSGTTLWTGDAGIGINQLSMAFLAQHGFDIKKWPKALK